MCVCMYIYIYIYTHSQRARPGLADLGPRARGEGPSGAGPRAGRNQ